MKICTKCNLELEFEDFYKKKNSKSGYNNICKNCRKTYNEKNKNISERYYLDNKEKINQSSKIYYINNKDKHNVRVKEWQKNNKSKKLSYFRKWRIENKEYFRLYSINYYKNLNNKISHIMRVRMSTELKNYKSNSTIILLGCSIGYFKEYISNQFRPEMNWDNHGEVWELDHIKPCSSFNLIDINEQKECFNYINYQPLFKTTAIAKEFGYLNETGNRNKSNN